MLGIMQLRESLWGCGEQAIPATKTVFVNLERLLCKPVSGPNIWLLLITSCPCFIPSHLLLLGPEFFPNCQGWMISKIRLSLSPWCQCLGHGQVSFSVERWRKRRSLSLPPSTPVAKLFCPVSPTGEPCCSFSERGRNRGWMLTHLCLNHSFAPSQVVSPALWDVWEGDSR